MKVLALSDIHGNWRGLKEVMSREDYDTVLIAGDLSDYSGSVDRVVNTLVGVVRERGVKVYTVLGNMDNPDLLNRLSSINEVTVLHGSFKELNNYLVVGFSGGLYSPFHTPFEFSDEHFKSLIDELSVKLGSISKELIILSHTPPYNTKVDLTFNGLHVGSQALREFIELHKPVLVICGHIHEGRGVDKVGSTLIINPGPLLRGYYAVLELGKEVKYELRSLK
jgi:Icc-related predicted phosphoesterase